MKKILILILWISILSALEAQTSFEGYIIYRNMLLSPNPAMISDSLYQEKIKATLGGFPYFFQKYYYQGKNYKSEMNINGNTTLQLYNPNDLKLYTWSGGKEEATYVMTNVADDEIVKIEKFKEEEVILGEKCKKIVIIGKKMITTYWYNPNKYKVNYEDYKSHSYSFWNEYLKQTGALPLKFDVKTSTVHIISTANEVKVEKIKSDFFDLPKFKSVAQSKLY
ncbi:MAG: hypothetical protein RL115_445 [Bacteroidota bacterium]|jgi:hypothetical protein